MFLTKIFSKIQGQYRSFTNTSKTIFAKIIDKEIPAKIIYEDKFCLAFHDITPQAPTHIILIPKITEIPRLSHASEKHQEILGHLLLTVGKIAKQQKIASGGYRVVINEGKNGQQTVEHLHLHIIGGKQLKWPPG